VNILKNKICFILFIVFLLFLYTSSVKAYTYNASDLENIEKVQEGYNYCIFESDDGNTYLCVCNNNVNDIITHAPSTGRLQFRVNSSHSDYQSSQSRRDFSEYLYNTETSTFDYIQTTWAYCVHIPTQMIYTSVDIVEESDWSTVFFQVPPPIVEEVEKVELMTPMEVEEIPEKINQTVKILLVVSLGLFSISSVTLVLLYRIFGKGSLML